jgi:Zn-dependent peptidase ImmA (M78 family)
VHEVRAHCAADSRRRCAFLIPADALIDQLGRNHNWNELRELQLIKEAWELSMAAVMLRACALGVITPNTGVKLWKHFEDNGWDKRGPVRDVAWFRAARVSSAGGGQGQRSKGG